MVNWTNEQQNFINKAPEDEGINLEAVAGSGKTTTLVAAVTSIAELKPFSDVTCVAFNKSIADEMGGRMPASVRCKTMNAIGHGAWIRKLGGKLTLDKNKTRSIINELHGKSWEIPETMEDLMKLVGLAKVNGIVPERTPYHEDVELVVENANPLVWDEKSAWQQLIDHFDLSIEDDYVDAAIEEARNIINLGIEWAFNGIIDFNDQLYMPVCFGGKWFKSDRVLIDEAQDISSINRVMLRNILKPTGTLIAVGDPHQAIYGFRGAAHDSMELLHEEFNTKTMELTYSFRCSRAVIEEAQKLVPHIKWRPDAPEGSVVYKIKWNADMLTKEDVIICRNVAPMMALAFRLIRRNIPCYIKGRDIGFNLIGLIKFLKAHSIDELMEKMDDWKRKKISRYQNLGMGDKVDSIRDRVATIVAVIENIDTDAQISDLNKKIMDMFSGKTNGVCMSTIHKVKGLEWPRVFFLDTDLIPSKYATKPWQIQQEENLKYVGVTRAQVDLVYITSGGLE